MHLLGTHNDTYVKVTDSSVSLTVVTFLQCVYMSKHQAVCLKYIQF